MVDRAIPTVGDDPFQIYRDLNLNVMPGKIRGKNQVRFIKSLRSPPPTNNPCVGILKSSKDKDHTFLKSHVQNDSRIIADNSKSPVVIK